MPFKIRQPDKIEKANIEVNLIRLLDREGKEKKTFLTNEPVELNINFKDMDMYKKNVYLRIGIYRSDDICCQVISVLINSDKNIKLLFPEFKLLPGRYKLSASLLDDSLGIYDFKMAWKKQDHGTIYMDHKWRIK
jgi:hypothetical protein